EAGEYAGHPYLALEFVAGGSLDRHLAGTPQPARAAAELVETLARAVAYAHTRGILHRDLKPANVLLHGAFPAEGAETEQREKREITGQEGQRPLTGGPVTVRGSALSAAKMVPKIADFGLTKWLGDGAAGPTCSGDVLGTPGYMAPEQAEGRREL